MSLSLWVIIPAFIMWSATLVFLFVLVGQGEEIRWMCKVQEKDWVSREFLVQELESRGRPPPMAPILLDIETRLTHRINILSDIVKEIETHIQRTHTDE